MKINCDFLPGEYKAVRRNLKLMFAAIAVWVLTALLLSYKAYSYRAQLKEVDAQVASQETNISLLEGQINAVKYPQDKIKTLIEKFRFIQQAMGSEDYPYLEFFQALEEAVPVSEDSGLRRIAITGLKQSAGAKWELKGAAVHWDDILKFEDRLNESTFDRPIESADGAIRHVKKKNFRAVRVFTVDTGSGKGSGVVTFQMEFEFDPS